MAADGAADDEANRVHEAFAFYLETLRAWAADQHDVERSFEALTAVVRSLLKLVVIDLDAEDDAQVIFESLNARGTPLLAIDLVKNLVFQHAERTGVAADLDSLYENQGRLSTSRTGVKRSCRGACDVRKRRSSSCTG